MISVVKEPISNPLLKPPAAMFFFAFLDILRNQPSKSHVQRFFIVNLAGFPEVLFKWLMEINQCV